MPLNEINKTNNTVGRVLLVACCYCCFCYVCIIIIIVLLMLMLTSLFKATATATVAVYDPRSGIFLNFMTFFLFGLEVGLFFA